MMARFRGGRCRRRGAYRARDLAIISSLQTLRAKEGQALGASYACRGALWERLIHPFLLAALNTEPEAASAKLVATVISKTLAKGGNAYRPRIAHSHPCAAFIDPAIAQLKDNGANIHFNRRLHRLVFDGAKSPPWNFHRTPYRSRRTIA